ncbi:hypothetical protein PYCCODRAFT_833533 [Trametes coccinea BRFM310]|uniref:Uncharacterized protein n=1 Tax=Trametes coccinea (strain BRFM310) TaxID=1353009 RepID=A0A1Y2IEJ3_TRAC3|nr:hypothetical protein PYCCODRAFT_833533 [Trametes coccinea BRFM310]
MLARMCRSTPFFSSPPLPARRSVLCMCLARRSSVGRTRSATNKPRCYFDQGTAVSCDPQYQNFVEESRVGGALQPLVDRRCAGRLPRGATGSTCLLPEEAPRSSRPADRAASIKNACHGGQLRCARVVCGGWTYTRAHSRAT